MVGAQHPLLVWQQFDEPLQRHLRVTRTAGLPVPALGLEQPRQVVEAGGRVGVVGAQRLLADRQRQAEQRLRLPVSALGLEQLRQVVEAGGRVGVVGAQRLLADRQRQAEQRLRLGISGTKVKVISGSIQQPRRLRDAQVLSLDPTPGGQGVAHETFAPWPGRVFHVRKCLVQGLDGPFGEILAFRGGHLVEEHGLDEAVDGVGPGLDVAAHEGVAG